MRKIIPLLLALLLAVGCGPVGTTEIPATDAGPVEEEAADPAGSQDDASGDVAPDTSDVVRTPEEEKAVSTLAAMTLEEKVGQMFLARCPETDAAEQASQYALGGYILFGRDFQDKTREQAAADIAALQAAVKTPLLIAVDEEGGTVNRVSRYKAFRSVPFKSPRALYDEGGFDLIQTDTADKCRLLSSLGINVNMAPVADVTLDTSAFMYQRSFGRSAELTAQYVRNVVSVMEAEGMGSVLKHFPGYGDVGDSHTAMTFDDRPLETFENADLQPFREGIACGADAVLVCHNVVQAMDAENPASLSPAVHTLLREELGFDGVIVTDDLYMDAIRQFTSAPEAAVLAVEAGNDLVCCTEFEQQVPAVVDAVRSGRISESRIDDSVLRILLWKIDLGIL
ncbi:MAG: glycoside hydrolase family 3 N-terminal domain-containing protein [Clostridia bacterium]|nr:glycoside hydrolase family 3 N-terminal domain-containing protein [Clostridia bacterium]